MALGCPTLVAARSTACRSRDFIACQTVAPLHRHHVARTGGGLNQSIWPDDCGRSASTRSTVGGVSIVGVFGCHAQCETNVVGGRKQLGHDRDLLTAIRHSWHQRDPVSVRLQSTKAVPVATDQSQSAPTSGHGPCESGITSEVVDPTSTSTPACSPNQRAAN